MEKWKVLQSEYVFQAPFGNLRKDQCSLPNGQVIDQYYVNEYSDWVNAVVLTRKKRIVLVEQYRHAGGEFFLEIPAGKIEENETYEEGILREVREETGYTSSTTPIKLGEFMVNPATQTNKVITYLIMDAYLTSDQELDETEEIEVQLVDLDEFGTALKEGSIKTQLFTAYGYYLAKNYLFSESGKQEL